MAVKLNGYIRRRFQFAEYFHSRWTLYPKTNVKVFSMWREDVGGFEDDRQILGAGLKALGRLLGPDRNTGQLWQTSQQVSAKLESLEYHSVTAIQQVTGVWGLEHFSISLVTIITV